MLRSAVSRRLGSGAIRARVLVAQHARSDGGSPGDWTGPSRIRLLVQVFVHVSFTSQLSAATVPFLYCASSLILQSLLVW